MDNSGIVYVTDQNGDKIRRIDPSGYVTTLAGTGSQGSSNQGASSTFNSPSGLVLDSSNNLYVADLHNHLIRKISIPPEHSQVALTLYNLDDETDDATITLTSSDTGEGTVSPATLTFTGNNWNTAQTVTVTGVNDNSSDGHQAYNINLTGVHSPHRYWRIRSLAKRYAWNIKQIQFLSDTTSYVASQNTIAQPESSAIHNGSNCIQSGNYPGHGCDRSFDNNLDSSMANWAAGNEAQTWIGMDFGSSPIDVVHVRLMPGRPQAAGATVAIEWSDDASNWTAWSGGTTVSYTHLTLPTNREV